MALFNMADLRAALPRHIRVLGLDPGAKIIGVALSDVTLMLASPYGSLKRGKLRVNAAEIGAICAKEGAGGLLVGLPLSMDGTRGPAAQAASDWALALSEATGLPVAMWDERLSSAAVNRAMIQEADLTRKRRAAAVDAAAAAYTLQAALDATRPRLEDAPLPGY
jgi:putative Holliday junction resolvase